MTYCKTAVSPLLTHLDTAAVHQAIDLRDEDLIITAQWYAFFYSDMFPTSNSTSWWEIWIINTNNNKILKLSDNRSYSRRSESSDYLCQRDNKKL